MNQIDHDVGYERDIMLTALEHRFERAPSDRQYYEDTRIVHDYLMLRFRSTTRIGQCCSTILSMNGIPPAMHSLFPLNGTPSEAKPARR